MKRIIATATALAMLTTTALADDTRVARGMMLASLYDRDCQTIDGLIPMINRMLEEIPASVMRDGMQQAAAIYRGMSKDEFCKKMRPLMENGLASIR